MTSTAFIHLDRLSHNLALLRRLANGRPLWPAIKANAYDHAFRTERPRVVAQPPGPAA